MEKQELELFRQGQFVIEDEEKEDANASTERPIPIDTSVEVTLHYLFDLKKPLVIKISHSRCQR